MARKTPKCMDCRINLLKVPGQYYMLHDHLWGSITTTETQYGELCLACVEKRLHRELTRSDFAITPLMLRWRLSDMETPEPDDSVNWA